MAYQTGIINYKGSFKSIRNYTNVGDPKIYAGEKGGANRDLVLNNPAFARTRENMNEFKGCGKVAKAIRIGLVQLLPEHANTHFTARLMKVLKMINLKDEAGEHGERAVLISENKTMLKSLNLHERRKIDYEFKRCIRTSYPDLRGEATLTVNGFNPGPQLVPGNAQFYRVVNHVSIVADYAYDKRERKYKPLSKNNVDAAYVYSDYMPVNTPLSVELKAAFPAGVVLTDKDTVVQCVGVEFYNHAGAGGYRLYATGTMLLWDVF